MGDGCRRMRAVKQRAFAESQKATSQSCFRNSPLYPREITGKQNTNLPTSNMWRVRGLLQDPGHPVETPTEAGNYGVTRNARVVVDVRFARG